MNTFKTRLTRRPQLEAVKEKPEPTTESLQQEYSSIVAQAGHQIYRAKMLRLEADQLDGQTEVLWEKAKEVNQTAARLNEAKAKARPVEAELVK